MDVSIAAAARALAVGDALGALKHVALRDDPPALALRGIAMAQCGDYPRARHLLRRAARGFAGRHEVAWARCVVAQAEVALAMRDLAAPTRTLAAACALLEARGDGANAMLGRLVAVRRLLLVGRVDEAARVLGRLDTRGAPLLLAAVAELASAEIALRASSTAIATAALGRAQKAAERARIPALLAEVAEARALLDRPAARCLRRGREQSLRLDEVEALLSSGTLVVDACRRVLRAGRTSRTLARRPVLFALARALAEAWPRDVDRDTLILLAFRTRRPDDSHRARLRVAIGRLRALAAPWATLEASRGGYALAPRDARAVAVLLPPIDGDAASLLALLADGAAWSTSALALALGASQRTVQRALVGLEAAGRVRTIGVGRARRYLSAPLTGCATNLLLPGGWPRA